MREVLFRGKRTDNGEWVEGFYVRLFEKVNGFYKAKHYIFDGNTKLGEERYCGHGNYEQDVKICKFEVVPENVGQFTGLTDKNGTKIFEGDIVRCYCRSWLQKDICGYIVFGNACFSVQEIQRQDKPAMDLCSNFEIIGNVHDNPELLGTK